MWTAGSLAHAVPVTPDDSPPTFPDATEERAQRRDLVLLAASRRRRRRRARPLSVV
jgi:hypothetical protein